MTNEELVGEYQQTKSPEILDKILEQNEKLVKWLARKYKIKFDELYELEDLQQLARIGLWESVDKYHNDRGKTFASYALWYMKRKIIRHHAEIKSIQDAISLNKPVVDSDTEQLELIPDKRRPYWEEIEGQEMRRQFRELLKEILPADQWELVNRYYFKGEKLELKEQKKVTAGSFYSKLHRNHKFQKFIKGWELDQRTIFIRAQTYDKHGFNRTYSVGDLTPVERIVSQRLEMENKYSRG